MGGPPIGRRQLSKKERFGGFEMTAATVTAKIKPTKTIMMRRERDGGAGWTSCRSRRSAADEPVKMLVLPPPCSGTCLAGSPSATSDTCTSHAACRRQSESSGSVGALMLWRPSAAVGQFISIGISLSALAGVSPLQMSFTESSAICWQKSSYRARFRAWRPQPGVCVLRPLPPL
jgi:hypothetical protein